MKILLADPSEIYCDAIEQQLDDHYTVLRCNDGRDVIPMLREHQPDLLVLGLELPNIDGLTVLRMIRTAGIQVRVMVTSYIYSEYDLRILSEFAISHLVSKPTSICTVITHIFQMLHYEDEAYQAEDPDATLLLLGLRMNLAGYRCLVTAIRLLREDPGQSLTKELYPNVAKLCGGTSSRVERAIRCTIHDAWINRDEKVWMAYFPLNRNGRIATPSNGDFIARIAFYGKDNKACG